MDITYKKEREEALSPKQAHRTDAGSDLTAAWVKKGYENGIVEYGCGLAIEIPEGFAGFLFPRSSVYKTGMTMCNNVGVVDAGYRGEVTAKFYVRDWNKIYKTGERFGQLVIMPVIYANWVESQKLSESDRGKGGYGSSGK